MGSMVFAIARVLGLLALVAGYEYYNKDFRFDYEFNEDAGGWLKYHSVPATWPDARMQCHAEGAVLASPLTKQLKTAIISFVKTQANIIDEEGVTIFSGVHATYAKGIYTSIEGVPLLRLAITWAPGEPDNYDNSESCLVMNIGNNGTMADARCEGVLPYVCYKNYTRLTVSECGTIDHGYVMENRTGSCYKLHTKILSWSEAYKTCEAEGAYLAIINSDIEADVVKKILAKRSGNNFNSFPSEFYIGYRDWGQQQNFMTIHGQSMDEAGYQRWGPAQPNNLTIAETRDYGQTCGGISNNGRFNDLYCNHPFAFLCEMTPNSLQ